MTHVAQKLEPRSLLLIENVRAHPELWKYDEESFHSLPRAAKHRLWDEIAKRSGYQKTQDAKNKWRTLTFYFRQHMTNVAKKVQRRYIPNTGDPNDKYVQPTDWRYYEYMEFVERFNKPPPNRSAAGPEARRVVQVVDTSTAISANVVTTAPSSATATLPTLKDASSSPRPMQMQIGGLLVQIEPAVPASSVDPPLANTKVKSTATPASDGSLSESDRNLLAFFNAMLRSTQSLPRFHQERVKRKLINAIRDQK